MKNEAFVSNLLNFLNFVLKSVGLAPFTYLKSKRLFRHCMCSTILSFFISGFIITVSLPIEVMSAMNYKPNRSNTVSYAMGYLHIVFTLVKTWLNQILTLTNRDKIIKHFNQALHINDAMKSVCNEENLLDDRMVKQIKSRISLFILQCVAIIFGVNGYISRSFIEHTAGLLIRIFVSFTYISAILVTTIYLGGSLMLCERYCRILCKQFQRLIKDVNELAKSEDCQYKLKFNDKFLEMLKAYDVVVWFIDNSHNLFASHAVICACSTFLVCLHGVSYSKKTKLQLTNEHLTHTK